MLKQNKWDSILFQRRYVHILIQWVKLIPKEKFMNYFNIVLESLSKTTDHVLIYEYATCIHEMLKEIDYWLKMQNSNTAPQISPFGLQSLHSAGLRHVAKGKGDFLNLGDTGSDP